MSEESKAMVCHLVEAINAGEEDTAVDVLFAPRAARRLKRLFSEFRSAFPDWQSTIMTWKALTQWLRRQPSLKPDAAPGIQHK